MLAISPTLLADLRRGDLTSLRALLSSRTRVPVFVRSENSNALVGGGFANLDSAFGGMLLFATEAWRAAPLLLTRSAQLAQPTVRLPQL